MADFRLAILMVLRHEGGFFQDPNGGATKFGISLNFYRDAINPQASDDLIRNLTLEAARDIYKHYFWDAAPFVEIKSQKIAARLFDLSVNCGIKQAVMLIQRAVNSISPQALVVDGSLGPKTLKAINASNEWLLYKLLLDKAKDFYIELAKKDDNKRFIKGWLNRLND